MTNAPLHASYRIRAICPGDRDGLVRFYAGLSPESRASRFHGAAGEFGAPAAAYFCGPDHRHREGLVAETIGESASPEIIGHLCLEPTGTGAAEMAIAVADAWQQHGVGRALLTGAGGWARAHRIRTLTASMLWGNAAILALVRSMGWPVVLGSGDIGTVEARVELGGTLPHAA
jgi:GNAT superfamily N-acetyltransferase